MSISFNPYPTTGVSNGFVLTTDGYVQGTFQDDPAIRYQMRTGTVGQSTPIWGGLPLLLAVGAPGNLMGPSATVATSSSTASQINGWSVFNQASAGVVTPSSPVPLYGEYSSFNFFESGSNARIILAVESTAVLDALAGAAPNVALYWDTVNSCLTNAAGTGIIGPINVQLEALSAGGQTVSYNSSTGIATWNSEAPAAMVRI